MAGSAQNDDGEITGINVTPLVDIMLVLLIIFMVTATYIVKDAIPVELPKAATGGEMTAKTIAVVVDKSGRTYVDGVPTDDGALVRKIQALPGDHKNVQALISGDTGAQYGEVVHVMDLLKQQGVSKFGIEVEKTAASP